MGLRIIERVREEYRSDVDAHLAEEINPFTNLSRAKKTLRADIGSIAIGGPISSTHDKEDVGDGLLADDHDPDGGGFLFDIHEAKEVRHRAADFTIKEDHAPVHSGRLSITPLADSNVVKLGPPDTDDSEGVLREASSDDEAVVLNKVSAKRNGTASFIKDSRTEASVISPKRRGAKRQTARKIETVTKT